MIGSYGAGNVPGILKRLETKGHIERTFYQRGVQVCVDGVCTAPPPNQSTHWRQRPAAERCPLPTIQAVAKKSQGLWAQIEARAKRDGISPNDHMLDLLHIGNEVTRQSEGEWGNV